MSKCSRLSAVALGVAMGVLCGVWMLVVGMLAWHGVFGDELVKHWATMFPGVDATMKGSMIAGGWGFLKGFFYGLVLAWLYNLCLCCCTKCCPCCKSSCGTCGTAPKDGK
jgi:hypothetical protein